MKKKMYQSPEMDFKFYNTSEDVLNVSLDVDPDWDLDNGEYGEDEEIED